MDEFLVPWKIVCYNVPVGLRVQTTYTNVQNTNVYENLSFAKLTNQVKYEGGLTNEEIFC